VLDVNVTNTPLEIGIERGDPIDERNCLMGLTYMVKKKLTTYPAFIAR
jgi:hypothetical protein